MTEFGGCAWPVDTACFSDLWEGFSTSVKERSIALASATLHRLTGYRVGGCPVTIRPCKQSYARACGYGNNYYQGMYYHSFQPNNWAGTWTNSCGHGGLCGCTTLCEVTLPGPVGRLDSVKVDGVELDLDDLRIDNGTTLVWQGVADCPFPAVQDLSKPDTEAGTFSVTYLNAYPVDSLGEYAAGVLAMEYGRACTGNKCRLPSGVSTIVRQGITMEVQAGAFPNGMTGIREVDSFIALWNPNNLQRSTSVYSPDLPRHRTVTGGIS